MKKITAIIIFILFALGLFAQDSINAVILSMPNKIIDGLEAAQKDLLVSNPEDTAVVTISTNIYPEMKRTSISDNYVRIQTSEVGDVQIKLLPLINDSRIICVVTSVCGQICDSEIAFYTTDWKPIETSTLFPDIKIKSFIKPDADINSDAYKNAISVLDINPVKITLSANDDNLTLEYDIKRYLAESDYVKLESFLIKEPVYLYWDKVSFK